MINLPKALSSAIPESSPCVILKKYGTGAAIDDMAAPVFLWFYHGEVRVRLDFAHGGSSVNGTLTSGR